MIEITASKEYNLNNMNVAAQDIQLGTFLKEVRGSLSGSSGSIVSGSATFMGKVGIGITPTYPLDIYSQGTIPSPYSSKPGVNILHEINPATNMTTTPFMGMLATVKQKDGNTYSVGAVSGFGLVVRDIASSSQIQGMTINVLTTFPSTNSKGIDSVTVNTNTASGFGYAGQFSAYNRSFGGTTGVIATLTALRIKTINEAYSSGGSNTSAGDVRGIHLGIDNNGESPNFAIATNSVGFDFTLTNNASGCIVNSYGVRLNAPINSGTITNHYGLYIANQTITGATENYSLYIAGGKNYIGANATITGSLTIGTGTDLGNAMVAVHHIRTTLDAHAFEDYSLLSETINPALGYASFDSRATLSGSSNVGHMASFQARNMFLGSGSLLSMRGLDIHPVIAGGGVVNELYGIYIKDATGDMGSAPITGSVVQSVGIYLEAITNGIANYAIYSAGGSVHLAGRTSIGGTSTPTDAKLQVISTSSDEMAIVAKLTGSGANQINIYPFVDGKCYIQHNGDLVFCPVLSVTSQFTIAADGKMGFFGHASGSRPAKAEHNNWAAISDVVQALVDIGLLDTV